MSQPTAEQRELERCLNALRLELTGYVVDEVTKIVRAAIRESEQSAYVRAAKVALGDNSFAATFGPINPITVAVYKERKAIAAAIEALATPQDTTEEKR